MSAPECHISTPAVEMPVERPRRARARARAQAHQRLGTFSPRAVHRTAHGNHSSKAKLHHASARRSAASPSSRPRDGGSAGGARTREDTLSPQRSEDEREGGLTTDLYGNLLRVDLPDGRAIEYEVDGAGRRVGRRELDADGFEISFRGWIYRDLLRPIAEVDAFGSVVARYIYSDGDGARQNGVYQLSTRLGANQDTSLPFSGSNVPESIELLDPGTGLVIQRMQLSTNQVGSVQLVTDADTGDVLQRIEYDEFGRVVFDSNPGVQPFGFAGGLYDEESELVRFGARDYLSDAGRWTARDPLRAGVMGGRNLYLYVENDPIGEWDSNGFDLQRDLECLWKAFKADAACFYAGVECGSRSRNCLVALEDCKRQRDAFDEHCGDPEQPGGDPPGPQDGCEGASGDPTSNGGTSGQGG